MQYKIRKSEDRGFFDHGWLKTYHTFSFGDYYDPNFMGFRSLRVINEDFVAAGRGFPAHPHKEMEILTLIIAGDLAHRDSLDTEEVIRENEIQLMSAGKGITHSEYNPSNSREVHLFQIWILPDTKGLEPFYQQKKLPTKRNEWDLIVSKEGRSESLNIHQDVDVFTIRLDAKTEITYPLPEGRFGWLQVISGTLSLGKDLLKAGDGVAFEASSFITLKALSDSHLLFFDLE